MGEPRRFRNKYSRPGHPWQLARIESERALLKEYGLKTKRELWKADSRLKSFTAQAKKLVALRTKQAEVERKQLIDRMNRLGLLSAEAKLADILALSVRDILNRRLQTIVHKKGLARTPIQARQFIVHQHVLVGPKKISTPGYIVPVSEETQISFVGGSTLANPEHPERAIKEKPAATIAKEAKEPKKTAVKGGKR